MEEWTKDGLQGSTGCHPVVEDLISKQVAAMKERGQSRAEAERLVLRFQGGRNYLHVVDEIYPPGEVLTEPAAPEARGSRKRRRLAALRSIVARD
jgi:hypothetical protein